MKNSTVSHMSFTAGAALLALSLGVAHGETRGVWKAPAGVEAMSRGALLPTAPVGYRYIPARNASLAQLDPLDADGAAQCRKAGGVLAVQHMTCLKHTQAGDYWLVPAR